MKVGDLVQAPVSREGHWWSQGYGLIVDWEDWGQGDVLAIVLMQGMNKKCTFYPNTLSIITSADERCQVTTVNG